MINFDQEKKNLDFILKTINDLFFILDKIDKNIFPDLYTTIELSIKQSRGIYAKEKVRLEDMIARDKINEQESLYEQITNKQQDFLEFLKKKFDIKEG